MADNFGSPPHPPSVEVILEDAVLRVLSAHSEVYDRRAGKWPSCQCGDDLFYEAHVEKDLPKNDERWGTLHRRWESHVAELVVDEYRRILVGTAIG